MKKVVFFTPSLKIGGIERVFLTYAENMVGPECEVNYLTCNNEVEIGSIDPRIRIINIGTGRLRSSLIELGRFLKNENYDAIITGGDIPNLILIIIKKIFKINAKLIISQHNYLNLERSTILSTLIIKYFYRYSDVVIAISKGIKEFLLEKGVCSSKVKVIYNPINIEKILSLGEEELGIDLPENYVTFVGRLGEVKNLELLIRSYKVLEKKIPTLELVIVGVGPVQGMLKYEVKRLGIEKSVHFFGVQSNPFPILKRAKAVVLSSFSEALPTIVLESFIFGKTVISTPTLGAIDLLDRGCLGYLGKSFNDAKEFSTVIEKALTCPISHDSMKLKLEEFRVDRKVEELMKIING